MHVYHYLYVRLISLNSLISKAISEKTRVSCQRFGVLHNLTLGSLHDPGSRNCAIFV